jgi:hypothetical protein
LLNKLKQIPNAKRLLYPFSVKNGNKYVAGGAILPRMLITNIQDVKRITIPLVLLNNLGSNKSAMATPI